LIVVSKNGDNKRKAVDSRGGEVVYRLREKKGGEKKTRTNLSNNSKKKS